MNKIISVNNRNEVVTTLCNFIKAVSNECITNNGYFNIGVSGGSVGVFLQEGLPHITTDFTKWRIFFCDERVVPEDSSDSTFGFYKKNLIGPINLNECQFVSIKQGVSAEEAAQDYVHKLTETFNDSLPCFDMLLLGLGPDGHTCSLFPGHEVLEESEKWVASVTDSPKPPQSRITFTFSVINNAKNVVFAACGKEKAAIINDILLNKSDVPAARVKPSTGKVYWILDKDACGSYKPN